MTPQATALDRAIDLYEAAPELADEADHVGSSIREFIALVSSGTITDDDRRELGADLVASIDLLADFAARMGLL